MNDGGAAFPGLNRTEGHGCARRNAAGEWEVFNPGMSLRAYFAAAALQGWAAGRNCAFTPNPAGCPVVAAGCVAYADALIAELEKKP